MPGLVPVVPGLVLLLWPVDIVILASAMEHSLSSVMMLEEKLVLTKAFSPKLEAHLIGKRMTI